MGTVNHAAYSFIVVHSSYLDQRELKAIQEGDRPDRVESEKAQKAVAQTDLPIGEKCPRGR